jgi:ribosomal protein S27E
LRASDVLETASYHPAVDAPAGPPDLHVIDIFMMSVKCGNCDSYQTVVGFKKLPEKNVYTYECENEICDPNVTRTILEVPKEFDNSTKRAEELPYYTAEAEPDSPGE